MSSLRSSSPGLGYCWIEIRVFREFGVWGFGYWDIGELGIMGLGNG